MPEKPIGEDLSKAAKICEDLASYIKATEPSATNEIAELEAAAETLNVWAEEKT